MSVVGPRPALPNEVATYNDYQRQRLLVKPGMTCYWQTRRNRDSITFDEWVDLDLWERAFLLMPRRCAWAVVKTPSDAESSSMAAMLFAYFMLRLYENFRHLQHRSVTRRLCD